ncbi:MAG: SDR family oxidoreductase [Magnetococcales bacterium]|nr:SDR family oxidoreductase [Magnetococcales bacterium]
MSERRQHHIITGGSSGIGLALARQLAAQGAHLTLIARNEEKLQRARDTLTPLCTIPEQTVLILVADLSNAQQAQAAIQEAITALGAPEWLFLNAGIAHPGYVEALPLEIFETSMACNYFGSLYPLLAALPAMRERGRGRIIFTSSGAALIGVFGHSAYAPSKYAQRGLAEVLILELQRFGIGVSIVYPPDTDTPQLEAENRTKPWQTKRIAQNAGVWDADKLATVILSGVRKGRFVIAPGLAMGLLNALHSLIGPLLRRYFAFLIRPGS